MQARATPTFHSRRQKRVQSLACGFGCYRNCEVRIVIDNRAQLSARLVRSSAFMRLSALKAALPNLLLTRSDRSVRREPIVNELVYVSLDEFAIDDPGFFHQYVAV